MRGGWGLDDQQNYCRNPTGAPKGIWCYLAEPTETGQYWETCEPRDLVAEKAARLKAEQERLAREAEEARKAAEEEARLKALHDAEEPGGSVRDGGRFAIWSVVGL